MEKMNTKEDFLKRFEAAKQRKHEDGGEYEGRHHRVM